MVEIFGLAQTNQVKVQSQVYEQIEQMQNEMYVARGLLAEVSSSASNLQATIEGTSTRMAQQIATISGMTEKVFRWGWLLLVVAFLLHQSRPLSISTPLGTSTLLLGRSLFSFLFRPFGSKYFSTFMGAAPVFAFIVVKASSGFLTFCHHVVDDFDMVLIHYASGTRIPLFPVFFFAMPSLLATVAFYIFRQNFPAFRPSRNLAFSTGPLLLSSDVER